MNKLTLCLSLLRSVYLNFKFLPLDEAIKVPLLFHYKFKIDKTVKKGMFEFRGNVFPRMVSFGMNPGSFKIGGGKMSYLRIKKGGKLIFEGKCSFAKGSQIIVNENGTIVFGKSCSFNANTLLNAGSRITFGDYFLGGWNDTILDGDGHIIKNIDTRQIINVHKPITFGKHCWLAANCSVSKGVPLGDDTIVPYGSVITKSCGESYVIYGGQPNKVLKRNIYRDE